MFCVHFCPCGTLYFQDGQKRWTKMDKKYMEIVRIFVFKPRKIVETISIHQIVPYLYTTYQAT